MFVDDVAANGNTPFSISSYSDAEIDSAEFMRILGDYAGQVEEAFYLVF